MSEPRPIWLPAVEELCVPEALTAHFSARLDAYIREGFTEPPEETSTVGGAHTHNILTREDPETHAKLDELRALLEDAASVELEYYWVHLIEYAPGGYQRLHEHAHNEDYSFVLYLDEDREGGGATQFLLNPDPAMSLALEASPRRGRLVLFLSQLLHESKAVVANKRVLVGGLRVKGLRAPGPGWRLRTRRGPDEALDEEQVLRVRAGVCLRSLTRFDPEGPTHELTYANALGHSFEASAGTLAVLELVDAQRSVAELLAELEARGRRFPRAAVLDLLRQLVAAEILQLEDEA